MEAPVAELLSIGRFARACGLTVKALRHYDELGLLRPSRVDEETGYRYYGAEQQREAEAIRRLRRLEVPLDEIRILLASEDPAEVRTILNEHRSRIASRAAELHVVLQGLQPLIEGRQEVMDGVRAEGLDAATERKVAVDLFNHTWMLLDKADRTREEDDEMLHAAHASRYHWIAVGTTVNAARGEWQVSRVYAVLGRSEPALWHARRALEYCEQAGDNAEDWDLPVCFEGLARAHAVAGEWEESQRWLVQGREAAASIAGEEDRELVLADLATVPLPA